MPAITAPPPRNSGADSGKIKPAGVARFRKTVYAHFNKHGRDLPWRKKPTPYRTFVSEIMLQQTRVPRVAVFFPRFVRRFPGWRELAGADLKEVLAAWQGLGYNRRARFLREAAREVRGRFKGKLPEKPEMLETLPGVGKATAASIAAFGFNFPAVFVETNIRAVFIHHFFSGKRSVRDAEIARLAALTLDAKNPRKWYSALMDYGTALKAAHKNPARRSAHHKTQRRFEGSFRQARGAVLKALVAAKLPLGAAEIAEKSALSADKVEKALAALAAEGFCKKLSRRWTARL